MSDLRKAAEMALEALESLDCGDTYKTHNAASALRQALAQHVDKVDMSEERVYKTEKSIHEPVAYVTDSGKSAYILLGVDLEDDTPLYTAPPSIEAAVLAEREPVDLAKVGEVGFWGQASQVAPPQKEWVGLTEDEFENILEIHNEATPFAVYLNIEAKLKEKNSG